MVQDNFVVLIALPVLKTLDKLFWCEKIGVFVVKKDIVQLLLTTWEAVLGWFSFA